MTGPRRRGRARVLAAGVVAALAACGDGAEEPAPSPLLTRAEASDWVETTRYDEVVDFVRAVADADPRIHVTTFGYTHEGRALPLVVVGAPAATPDAVRGTRKLRVYLQGNIHGGEVPGKEALLMLLREISEGRHDALLDSLVLLVAPIYNADGNERVALTNRPRQHGPVAGMGTRANALGLDLNRDHMKLDAPEARSLARMLTAYDPHVGVDLHTTNGTIHAYHLTYSPPLHPDTPAPITELLRTRMLPEITGRVREETGWHFYYYGNVFAPRPGEEPGWATFDARPRFGSNYLGLRNRVGILSEAYAYLTLQERVAATRRFVDEILAWTHDHPGAVREAVEAAAAEVVPGSEIAIRSAIRRSAEPVPILMGAVDTVYNAYSGALMLHRLDVVDTVPMYEWGTFDAAETVVAPDAYYVPSDLAEVIDRLRAHGVQVEAVAGPIAVGGEAFRVEAVDAAAEPFQGRIEKLLHGAWRADTVTLERGAARVPLDQPLGRLAVHLLEPRAEDGFANWGILDPWIVPGEDYPIVRGP